MNTPTLNPADEINGLHREICDHARKSLASAIRIGELLAEQKQNRKHGEWLPWLKANLAFSDDTARRYIMLHSRRHEIPHCAEFGLTETYRLLSAPIEKPDSPTVKHMKALWRKLSRAHRKAFVEWVKASHRGK